VTTSLLSSEATSIEPFHTFTPSRDSISLAREDVIGLRKSSREVWASKLRSPIR